MKYFFMTYVEKNNIKCQLKNMVSYGRIYYKNFKLQIDERWKFKKKYVILQFTLTKYKIANSLISQIK